MKTLIINGSTRKNGDIQSLLDAFSSVLDGETRTISYSDSITPCADCRYCWNYPGCAIKDGMQDIYPFLEGCDNIVLASPIWFSSLSGPTLDIASRLQTYFSAWYFRGEPRWSKLKNGVILLCGAEPGTEKPAIQTALTILKHVNVDRSGVSIIRSMNTNRLPTQNDDAALNKAKETAQKLNRLCK